jgi:hypothetical protein
MPRGFSHAVAKAEVYPARRVWQICPPRGSDRVQVSCDVYRSRYQAPLIGGRSNSDTISADQSQAVLLQDIKQYEFLRADEFCEMVQIRVE